MAVTVFVFLGLAVAVGVVWALAWDSPSGVAYQGRFVPTGEASRGAMSLTGHYIVLAVGAGAVGAFITALVARRRPLLSWLVGLVSAVVAGLVAAQVGYALGPADPAGVAAKAADGTPVAMAVTVAGLSPYLAFPVGALIGFTLGFLVALPLSPSRVKDHGVGSLRADSSSMTYGGEPNVEQPPAPGSR